MTQKHRLFTTDSVFTAMRGAAIAGFCLWAIFGPSLSAAGGETAPVDESRLKPGLAVWYFHKFKARHLKYLPDGDRVFSEGKPGKPIPYLDHAFGKKKVFDSGTRKEIGMHMTGYVKISTPGTFWFKAYANDGIRVFVNDQVVVEDPGWHPPPGDRFSEPRSIDIAKSGWCPITVRYFQRRGTATIKLYWKQPGEADYQIVPAEAYAHTASQAEKK